MKDVKRPKTLIIGSGSLMAAVFFFLLAGTLGIIKAVNEQVLIFLMVVGVLLALQGFYFRWKARAGEMEKQQERQRMRLK